MVVEKSSTSPKIEGRLLCIVGCRRRRSGPRALKELAAQVGGIARDGCFKKEKVGYSSTVSMIVILKRGLKASASSGGAAFGTQSRNQQEARK